MSALAKYFHAHNKHVAGYDLTPSAITHELEDIGIKVHYSEDISLIPADFKPTDTLVVRTPAVPDEHSGFVYFKQESFKIRKRAEVLGILFNAKRGIAVAGTHGKTSVSSMLTHIMHLSSLGCNAFLGGISKNLQSNLLINEKSDWLVAEADEFDRSFLQLFPEMALVTWIDADHLDIYKTKSEIVKAFGEFLSRVNNNGNIVLKHDIKISFNKSGKTVFTYSFDNPKSDFHASDIQFNSGRYQFSLNTPRGKTEGVTLTQPGQTNVENAVGAASLAYLAGVETERISEALSSYKGVKRRFDIRFESPKITYIDDYAHHPRELDAIIGSVKKLYPDRKITGVFQPHLFSRTRDFAAEFARSLSKLDELILLDIYPAREKPIEGVSSAIIYNEVRNNAKSMCKKEELIEGLKNKDIDVLLTMGAGDIDRYPDVITKILREK